MGIHNLKLLAQPLTLCRLRAALEAPPVFIQNNYLRFQNYAPRFLPREAMLARSWGS